MIIFLREPRALSVRASNHLAKALPFGSQESAMRAGSFPAAPEHCRIGQALSRGVSFHSRADQPHQKEDHQIWSSLGGLLQLLQARLLDLADLLANELLLR